MHELFFEKLHSFKKMIVKISYKIMFSVKFFIYFILFTIFFFSCSSIEGCNLAIAVEINIPTVGF